MNYLKYITSTIFCLTFFSLIGQKSVTTEKFNFRFVKAIKTSNSILFEMNTSNYSIKSNKEQKKIQVRFKMKSNSNEKEIFDPNKFYLISNEYKIRLRPVDIKNNYAVGAVFVGFAFLINERPKTRREKEWFIYNPEIKDSFKDFQLEGYEDIDCKINFGTKRKPKLKSHYYGYKKLKSCRIDVYFIVPKEFKNGKVYYGETLLTDFSIK